MPTSVFGRFGYTASNWPIQGARGVIEASLATILFALLPFVVHGFGATLRAGCAAWHAAGAEGASR